MNNSFKVDITPDPEKGIVDYYTFDDGVKNEIIKFLSVQPYAEVREYIASVESQHLSPEQISNLIYFISKFPLYLAIQVFQLVITEGSIIPIYLTNIDVEVQEISE
jgi:hypothetical protein